MVKFFVRYTVKFLSTPKTETALQIGLDRDFWRSLCIIDLAGKE